MAETVFMREEVRRGYSTEYKLVPVDQHFVDEAQALDCEVIQEIERLKKSREKAFKLSMWDELDDDVINAAKEAEARKRSLDCFLLISPPRFLSACYTEEQAEQRRKAVTEYLDAIEQAASHISGSVGRLLRLRIEQAREDADTIQKGECFV